MKAHELRLFLLPPHPIQIDKRTDELEYVFNINAL